MIFFFNDTATTEIYTLSLHDALPISRGPGASRRNGRAHRRCGGGRQLRELSQPAGCDGREAARGLDRKSTRLNSSHQIISYAVFCLKKKKKRLVAPCSQNRNIYVYLT